MKASNSINGEAGTLDTVEKKRMKTDTGRARAADGLRAARRLRKE
jgi:hypothetical protein